MCTKVRIQQTLTYTHHCTNYPPRRKYYYNDIINSGIANDPHGSRNLYMNNQYYTPQLFSLMESNYNLMAVGTYRSNRKVSDSVKLLLE